MKQKRSDALMHIRSISWSEVFEQWRAREERDPGWIALYQERGFDSWEAWRTSEDNEWMPDSLPWDEYKITDPLTSVPQMLGGPFKGWKHLYGAIPSTLSGVIAHPAFVPNEKVESLINDFPSETALIAVQMDDDRYVIIDGMHRVTAITLIAQNPASLWNNDNRVLVHRARFPHSYDQLFARIS